MGRVIMSGIVPLLSKPYVGPKASLTPTSGVTYTEGLAGLEPAEISSYAQAISNVTGVTNDTTAMYIDYGSVHRKISIGDQVTIGVDDVNYDFNVMGFNHDNLSTSTAYGKITKTGKAGITFQMNICLYVLKNMEDFESNVNGWANCTMRKRMPSYFNQLPSAWQTIVKEVNKLTSEGGQSSTIVTTGDSLFLLSQIEVSGQDGYAYPGEGEQYAYYKMGNSNLKTAAGNPANWWNRSPSKYNSTSYCVVTGDGYYNDIEAAGTSGQGVSFAFCI